MKKINKADVAIVGAGIVGLAVAYQAALKGYKVALFERSPQALGASIRNFGLLWPIGQPEGHLFDRAIRSRKIWDELAEKAKFWKRNNGSLHLAYHQDELVVLEEYFERIENSQGACELMNKDRLAEKFHAVNPRGLLGGLYSFTEATVDPREALIKIPAYLAEAFGVTFRFDTAVTDINYPNLTTHYETWEAERIFVCSGADFETLYPEEFKKTGIAKCKLQMMRTYPQEENWNLGPTLCGGLTLTHYAAFAECKSLNALKKRIEDENPEFIKWGIHVMVTQNGSGELVIGDSHEYGPTPKPFDKEEINEIILSYLQSFARVDNLKIAERWHGIYPKLSGKTELILQPENGVTIVNGLGGAGMTLSFGLAEELFQ